MRVFHTPAHRRHRPRYEFAGGRQVPHADRPERIDRILEAAQAAGHEVVKATACRRQDVFGVHADDYIEYLAEAHRAWTAPGRSGDFVIPGAFAVRPVSRLPGDVSRRAGWHCLDTETPVAADTLDVALASAGCAVAAAELVASGEPAAYAACRPPGHHAGPDFCGGYCYLNNAALAARLLGERSHSPVAVLDLDSHHGNGTQNVFYECGDVFYASVHADPNVAYPYFWGYADETGTGEGQACNLNLPLPPDAADGPFLDGVKQALAAVCAFGPAALVVSLGTDGSASDPLGPLSLSPDAFAKAGALIAEAALPTVIVQEGGYDLETIGTDVVAFLDGLEGAPG